MEQQDLKKKKSFLRDIYEISYLCQPFYSLDPMLWNFLRTQFTNFRNKLECLFLAIISNLV